eukprot:685721-Pleurochrysis_carterae.AAC.2
MPRSSLHGLALHHWRKALSCFVGTSAAFVMKCLGSFRPHDAPFLAQHGNVIFPYFVTHTAQAALEPFAQS